MRLHPFYFLFLLRHLHLPLLSSLLCLCIIIDEWMDICSFFSASLLLLNLEFSNELDMHRNASNCIKLHLAYSILQTLFRLKYCINANAYHDDDLFACKLSYIFASKDLTHHVSEPDSDSHLNTPFHSSKNLSHTLSRPSLFTLGFYWKIFKNQELGSLVSRIQCL